MAAPRAPSSHVQFHEQLYNHVAFPRDVPGREDKNLPSIDDALLARLITATQHLSSRVARADHQQVLALCESLNACRSLHVDRSITKPALRRELCNLQRERILVLHLSAQNCGLLVYQDASPDGDQMVFEAFEVTPTSEQVLATKNALIRDFPGCAVSISTATLLNPSFLDRFSSFLQQASTEYVTKFSSITYKAAAPLPEVRNTSDPAVVTGLLMTMLEANGAARDVPILRKRVRDTVMFDQAFKPWRRSPFYLTLRVAMQRYLYKQFGPDVGRLYFKTIMCLMLHQFLEDVLKKLPFESAFYLRQKLGRRLAKLASDRAALSRSISSVVASALSSIDSTFEQTLRTSGGWLKTSWRNYKLAHERAVPLLSPHVQPGALDVRLTNSQPILSGILANQAGAGEIVQRTPAELLKQYDEVSEKIKPYIRASRVHMKISDYHVTIIEPAKEASSCGHPRIMELSDLILNYVNQIQAAPNGYPGQKSHMILHLMELWVLMDLAAVASFPLLKEFHPGFDADLLDPIELLALEDMSRVQQVQIHLISRFRARHGMSSKTIFDDPSDDCFAARYYEDYDDEGMQSLRLKIEDDADERRAAKEVEWKEQGEIYAETVRKRDETTCFYDEVPHRHVFGMTETRHRRPCEWHDLRDLARKVKIQIFEHPLPSYEPAAKAAMFELRCPEAFAAYRDATWAILSSICSPEPSSKPERVSLIREFSQLKAYTNDSDCSITLASEKKAFSETHYAQWGFPVELDDIIRTCGLKPRYFDYSSQAWTAEVSKASIWHHFPVMLPEDSPYHALQLTYATWPSSNEIQASQADCPAEITAHELIAMQGLLVGTHSRWLNLLRELGSTNINFSSDTAWTLVMRLILQIGPASTVMEARRDVHTALLDDALCTRMLHQIQQRLNAIHHNWREPAQMEILLTILLKIVSLVTSSGVLEEAKALLNQVRTTTDHWRVDLQSAVTRDARLRQFAISASLLCKRSVHADPDLLLDSSTLELYVSASVSLNYNLVEEFAFLPFRYKDAVIRDVMFSYEHRDVLRQALMDHTGALVAAINRLWQIPEGYEPTMSVSSTNPWWILLQLKPSSGDHQHIYFVHYNYIYGTLLIDGQEMSTLPSAYRRNTLFRAIFGDTNPMVFPSPIHGMSWAVSERIKGQCVHLGFRQGTLIVRAVHNDRIYEYIPSEVFGTTTKDLPAPLLSGCYHWLDVRNGDLEIRRNDMWISKPGNWWIRGIAYWQCQIVRKYGDVRETRLLNNSNETVSRIRAIFRSFVDLNQILVFTTRKGDITVELKSLEISFRIQNNGLLYSARLGAVITQNQDAGTWYGLSSKLVIQATANSRQKSILVPYNSNFQISRDDIHVSVQIGVGGDKYLKYDINEVLGRIDCPPEPSLLYTKALLHALTSHVIPDLLTSRTGVEESLRLLRTGVYQPWSPLNESHVALLQRLAGLSPIRGYYPPGSLSMETSVWRSDLTHHIQDDRFKASAEKILRRNSALLEFVPDAARKEAVTDHSKVSNTHLAERAITRTFVQQSRASDLAYTARDRRRTGIAEDNVYRITRKLLMSQTSSENAPSLLSLLHDAPVVGGYDRMFAKTLLTDLFAVDIKVEWGALTIRALKCDPQDYYNLIFLLGPMAFSENANLDLLCKLVSFFKSPCLGDLQPPPHVAYFHFRADGAPPSKYLVSFMQSAKMPFSPVGYKKRSQVVVAENQHEQNVERSCEALALSIQAQWPNPDLDLATLASVDPAHLDVERALDDLVLEWQRLTRNHELAVYLDQAQALLDRSDVLASTTSSVASDVKQRIKTAHSQQLYTLRSKIQDDPTLPRLLQQSLQGIVDIHGASQPKLGLLMPKSINTCSRPNGRYNGQRTVPVLQKPTFPLKIYQPPEMLKLKSIVNATGAKASHTYSHYANEMNDSIDALQVNLKTQHDMPQPKVDWISNDDIRLAKDSVRMVVDRIKQGLAIDHSQAKWLQLVNLWPDMAITDLLSELRSTSESSFGNNTKEALVELGVAVTKQQRLLRLQDAQRRHREQQIHFEVANQGHTNWNPLEYPDWLLLEIDGDIMLREEQVQVALATISPASGRNSVLQLLMGKGKTSCILPMVAAVLADKQDLARIVVPRPLLLQSAQVMHAKLGSLVNRELMHIPFSRKTPTKLSLMRLYQQMQSKMRNRGGIMITLPEHLLSFKLSGLQQLSDGHTEVAKAMVNIQEWLDSHARDVLDECDVSLAIRMQLVYPSGTQTSVDGHPLRWQVIQLLLDRIQNFITVVQSRHRNSVEVVNRIDGGYPLIYFLRKDAEDFLIELLVRDIRRGNCHYLPYSDFSEEIQRDIETYISRSFVRAQLVRKLTTYFTDKPQLMKIVNLLRGLFVHRILISSLKKRWNVQYGLHPTRAPIAVPFLAKSVPSVAAEWGHPDVSITLTCLSFYYQGLTLSQFKQAFEQLSKMDDPSVEYAKWVFPRAPLGYEDFHAVNVEDGWQVAKLFQVVRLNASLVNFYLNNFVFPKYAKTFSVKLQASGWNLFPSGTDAGCRVTGFSGTNDTRHQLPILINQADLPELAHTNAEVPFYLMAARNRGYVRMSHIDGNRWTELDLVENLVNPFNVPRALIRSENKIRILIDAGAQVLEHSNKSFAKAWLDADTDAVAAVYFDDDHRAWVLYRSNNRTPLLASPFAESLEMCVVYIDESHCRGTDLKLPVNGRAALTLGQHLTKDALVQAAMRLRQLGQSQSVAFYSPAEVHQSILDRLNKDSSFKPDSAAVLSWVFGQTCDTLEQQEPSYLAQAQQYMLQKQARITQPSFLEDEHAKSEFLSTILQREDLNLKEQYQPGGGRRIGFNKVSAWDESLQPQIQLLQDRQKRFQDNGSAMRASVLEEVEIEQERELELEVEQEVENVREVQKPPKLRPFPVTKLSADVEYFAVHGKLVAGSHAYQPMFFVLSQTALGLRRSVSASMRSNVWVSTQFSRTVEAYRPNDVYVRPVQWVVWSFISGMALLVSPEEANALIPILRNGPGPGGVHLIVYASPATRRMLHFNNLDYHATPPLPADFNCPTWLSVELGIFSGRLHFEWHEYADLRSYLGLKEDLSTDPDARQFAAKPLTFLHEWIDVRRKGQDFEHTPMGFVTTGKPLSENHAFFQASGHEQHADIRPHVARAGSGPEEQEEVEEEDSDHDEDEFVAVAEHLDNSESEDEESEGDDDEDVFEDAQEGGVESSLSSD